MKRFSLCAIIIIALMCSLFSGISFASSAEFEELVPDDWELLYKETFDNDTGQPINLNTIDYGSDHPLLCKQMDLQQ